MTYLDWTDALDLGLPLLDEQHKQLFAISNDLLDAIARGEGQDILKDIFDRLKEYTQYHFKEEEAYMKKIGYNDFDAHAAEHALLLVRVNTLWRMIKSGEHISPQGASLFLSDWITEHILHRDALIGRFAKDKA